MTAQWRQKQGPCPWNHPFLVVFTTEVPVEKTHTHTYSKSRVATRRLKEVRSVCRLLQ